MEFSVSSADVPERLDPKLSFGHDLLNLPANFFGVSAKRLVGPPGVTVAVGGVLIDGHQVHLVSCRVASLVGVPVIGDFVVAIIRVGLDRFE